MPSDTGRSSGSAASGLLLGGLAAVGLGVSYYLNRKKVDRFIDRVFAKTKRCSEDEKEQSAEINKEPVPAEQTEGKLEEKKLDNSNRSGSFLAAGTSKRPVQSEHQRAVENSVALSKLANQHYAKKEHSKAIALLSQAISLHENFKYYTNRALIYIHEKEYQKAYDDSLQSIKLNPTPKGYYALGRSTMGLKRFEEAMKYFDVIAGFPDSEAKDSKRLADKLSSDCSVKLAKRLKKSEAVSSIVLQTEENVAKNNDLNLSLELPVPTLASPASGDSPVTDDHRADEGDYDSAVTNSTSMNESKMQDSFYQSGVLVENPGLNSAVEEF